MARKLYRRHPCEVTIDRLIPVDEMRWTRVDR